MKKKILNAMILGLCCLLLIPNVILAEEDRNGVELEPAGIYLEGLKIGHSYNISDPSDCKTPFTLTAKNFLDSAVVFTMSITSTLHPEYGQPLRSGYEDIPDPSWITIINPERDCESDEEVEYAFIISIPNDQKYLNKRYQATILLHAHTMGTFQMDIMGLLQFAVGDVINPVEVTTLSVTVMNSANQVQVKDENRMPIAGCSVTISKEDGTYTTNAVTDSNGNAYFDNLTVGEYSVTATIEGYEKYETTTETQIGTYNTLQINLKKIEGSSFNTLYLLGGIGCIGLVLVALMVVKAKNR